MLASIIKKEKKKSLKILSYQPTLSSYIFFSLTPPVFFFQSSWDRIIHVCIPYLVKSMCLPVSGSEKEFIRKY